MFRLLKFHPYGVLGLVSFFLLVLLLLHPKEGAAAAVRGIQIWWDVLFPSLLPFFVISELMLGFGIVHFFGSLLDPVMRPLFRIPGIGGFVMTMGFASGYPVAARLTSQLWEQKLVNREEGERLVAFTTTADPIFLIGAVSLGFFHDVGLAVVLGTAHYGTALLVGFLMRFHGNGVKSVGSAAEQLATQHYTNTSGSLLMRSFNAMHHARLQDGRPFGLMLQQAVRSSIQLVFVIGGLVVFASTILALMQLGGTLEAMQAGAAVLLSVIGFPEPLSGALINGLLEVTLGAKAAGAAAASIPMVYKAAAGAFILSWAGLSVHAQIISVLHRTNLRYTPFLFARLIHGVLSAAAVILLWEPLNSLRGQSAATFINLFPPTASPELLIKAWSVPGTLIVFLGIGAVLTMLAFLFQFHIKMKEQYGKIK